jgi:hypothetical protein
MYAVIRAYSGNRDLADTLAEHTWSSSHRRRQSYVGYECQPETGEQYERQ